MSAASQANILLPRQHTSFVGREQDIQQLAALLADPYCRLLTLTGPGGIGKTRLAVEIAHRAQTDFPDGLYFVALQPLQAAPQVLSATIDALGVQVHQQPQPELMAWLQDKRLLLLLDNFEHVLEAASLVSAILNAVTQVKILVTSREPLRLQAEWLRQIDGLAYPAAVDQASDDDSALRLFVERARQRGIDLNFASEYPHIARICQHVEGNPLALELAAGWVGSLSCAAIAEELSHSMALLAARSQDVPPRHQSMQAVFAHSWRLLNMQEQAIMRRFSVFRGGATREAAEQVTGATMPQLAGLVEKSLLRHDAGRYDMQELLRQYAAEQLDATGENKAARASHSAFFGSFLQWCWGPLRSERQVDTLREIDQDFDNIRSAWQTMIETHNSDELGMAVYPLWFYSDMRGRYHDALYLYSQAEDALRPYEGNDQKIDLVIGRLRSGRGFFHVSPGKAREAQALSEQAWAILNLLGQAEDIVISAWNLKLASNNTGERQLDRLHRERVVQVAQQSDDPWLLGLALYAITYQTDDLSVRKQNILACLERAEFCGNPWLQAVATFHLAFVVEDLGDITEAARCFSQACALYGAVGQKVMVAESHSQIAATALAMKDYSRTIEHMCQSLSLLVEYSGYTRHKVIALSHVADLWKLQGKYESAIELLTLGLSYAEDVREQDFHAGELQRLKNEVPSDRFEAAQARGQQLEMMATIKAVLRELEFMAQTREKNPNAALPDPLTPRELEVLALLAKGLTNNDIARRLVITEGTVRGHLNKIYSKLGVENRVQAVKQAQSLHLL